MRTPQGFELRSTAQNNYGKTLENSLNRQYFNRLEPRIHLNNK